MATSWTPGKWESGTLARGKKGIAWSPNSGVVAYDGSTWDLNTNEKKQVAIPGYVGEAWRADGTLVLAHGVERDTTGPTIIVTGPTITVMRGDTKMPLCTLKGDGEPIVFRAFSPDGGTLLATAYPANKLRVYVWDTATGERIKKVDVDVYADRHAPGAYAVARDGAAFAVTEPPGEWLELRRVRRSQ